MKNLKITEIVFDPKETEPTLEDEFTMAAITRELESIDDPRKLKMAALQLLQRLRHPIQNQLNACIDLLL